MTVRWRCFVAAPLTSSLRADLATAVSRWRREPLVDGLRWADPDGWHLTLAFIGFIPADSVDTVVATIRRVAIAHGPFHLETGRLGAFHRAGSARTLWYGVVDPDDAAASLAADLARALGLALEEPFRPHVTLARARQRPVDLRGWIDGASLRAPSGELHVTTIELLRSHLGSGPARYERLASFDLGGGV